MSTPYELNESLARKVVETVDAGLVNGLGKAVPGAMCVEAAVCYAMGLPHSDKPTCVGAAVRAFKIRLNDARWSSPAARAKGMRRLAVAQLGSDQIDQKTFKQIVAEQTIRQIVPVALRAAAKRNPKHAERLEAAAVRCEKDGDRAAAQNANSVARAADADGDAAAAAYAAAYAAADADAYAAAYADAAAAAYAAAYAAADADAYAAAYADADGDAYADSVLTISAEIGLSALIELKSPGCEYLYLCD